MNYHWTIEPSRPVLSDEIARTGRVSPLLAQCLVNRGITDPAAATLFLKPRLKNLSDPFLLPGMEAAVSRLFAARDCGENVIVFGDYDVDGVTSTVLLLEVLRSLGLNVQHYLPHRQEDGYGLTRESAGKCLAACPAQLLLAVDCGSNAVDCIAWLKSAGVDVLVLDHHQLSEPLPPALALINPRVARPNDGAETVQLAELCSVGLAFKLCHALVKRGKEMGLPSSSFDLRPLLDLVALGTIADLVPLTGESRILASAGLERLTKTMRPGLIALKNVAQCPAQIGAYEVGFQLGPRLNAAGRLETAEDALNLLAASSLALAQPLAAKLHLQNEQRRAIEQRIAQEVIARATTTFDPDRPCVIIEGDPSWHIGVVGIVAARVQRHFYRPAIILGGDGQHWRGSGRSIAGFDLAAALAQCGDLLVRYGGHAMAAGVTLDPAQVGNLRQRLNELCGRAFHSGALMAPLRIDAEVGLDEMNLSFVAALDALRPFGQGNPAPQFCARRLTQSRPLQRIGAEKQHVKLWVTDGTATLGAVWWSAGSEALPVGEFDLAFTPQVNSYNGNTAVQLRVLDWQPSHAAGNRNRSGTQTAEMRF